VTTVAHGSGAWKDPNHYVNDNSLAGIRFIAEFPPHTLNVVGTDDGKTWWYMKGTCSGPGMTHINLDFTGSSFIQRRAITGIWAAQRGITTISFPDGNIWELLTTPTPAVVVTDGVDDHVGVFRDPKHARTTARASWMGLRVLAEFPAHQLKMVGSDSDNPTAFWFLEGICTGPQMKQIHFDFRPKGGPGELIGIWEPAPKMSITWPDGNVWSKFGGEASAAAIAIVQASALEEGSGVLIYVVIGVAILVVLAALVLLRFSPSIRDRARRAYSSVSVTDTFDKRSPI